MAGLPKKIPPLIAPLRPLNVFLCHSSGDKPAVRALCRRLRADGVKPWLDEEDIPGGVPWKDAIFDAVRATDQVIVCISQHSANKEGFLQRELKSILEIADEKLESANFLVPLRLEECEIPRSMQRLQWIDYFKENGHDRLIAAMAIRAEKVGAATPKPQPTASGRPTVSAPPQGAYARAGEAAEFILRKTPLRPRIGMVLGSGLNQFKEQLTGLSALDYDEIPHFPLPADRVSFGQLIVGKSGEVPVAVMSGRLHAYEGLRWDEVVFPMRLFYRMGIRAVILTAAVASLNPDIGPGTLVVLSDHINHLGSSPLSGPNDERFGPRFFDMTEVYSKRWRSEAIEAARKLGFTLHEAVYLGHAGPTYETPAELRAMRIQGADVVGMSTVPEAMAARQMGIAVLAICAVTSVVAGVTTQLDHAAVLESAQRLQPNLQSLLSAMIPKLAAEAGPSPRQL